MTILIAVMALNVGFIVGAFFAGRIKHRFEYRDRQMSELMKAIYSSQDRPKLRRIK